MYLLCCIFKDRSRLISLIASMVLQIGYRLAYAACAVRAEHEFSMLYMLYIQNPLQCLALRKNSTHTGFCTVTTIFSRIYQLIPAEASE